MRTSNNANQALRESEVGQVWREMLSGATGTLSLRPYQTFRVRATGATTITIDGLLAMTMSAGEIAIFNSGGTVSESSSGLDVRNTSITVVIGGASAFVQVGRDRDREI
jgi:hypothetical protein